MKSLFHVTDKVAWKSWEIEGNVSNFYLHHSRYPTEFKNPSVNIGMQNTGDLHYCS